MVFKTWNISEIYDQVHKQTTILKTVKINSCHYFIFKDYFSIRNYKDFGNSVILNERIYYVLTSNLHLIKHYCWFLTNSFQNVPFYSVLDILDQSLYCPETENWYPVFDYQISKELWGSHIAVARNLVRKGS